ncbi:fused MFS/spermidine synthase [Roseateles koreensis]|uniref:Fused MFS/spermidine synthase n=1 Tax=Roseateles koreensis TaxID=2987526 RepID=A0ABT5KTK8_9BURK|nr:fused MFS/spermidine synthase [Roseateles koreensis]MDC8786255.1 fused MFS/spermidine synthase [Roseateles koreensis]
MQDSAALRAAPTLHAAPARQAAVALLVMGASGFAGLGYQIVWTQQCGLWLGHESAAVLAVVSAFFGGMACGALALGPRIERSRRPRLAYVIFELVIALWGLLLLVALPTLTARLQAIGGIDASPLWQWSVAFVGCFLLLLPATAAMGATLPALERVMADFYPSASASGQRSVALFYAANTGGAVLGVLVTAFYALPQFGLSRTAGLCVTLNLMCAALAWVALPRGVAQTHEIGLAKSAPSQAARSRSVLRLAATGLLGVGYEVLVLRVLSQVTEDTVYTFAMLLAVYLIGTALGAAAWQRWSRLQQSDASAESRTQGLLVALAIAGLLGGASLWGAQALKDQWIGNGEGSLAWALSAEALLALAAFALPTLVMGALFSQLCANAHRAGLSFGQAVGINTLAAALAPLIFGVLLAPALGAKLTLLLLPLAYLGLCGGAAWLRARVWVPAIATLALAAIAPPLRFITLPEGGHIVSYREGAMAAVSVVEDAQGVSRLRINNRQQEGSSSSLLFDARQALLPLLLHPAPHTALFLGLGTGMTAASGAQDPSLHVDAVELLPEVIAASMHFTQAVEQGEPRLHTVNADARRYVRNAPTPYDVIVADNFHPARAGSAALYTVEHFQAVRQRLAPGGLFCQWLPLHQLDLQTLQSIVQSFLQAFPDATALLANNSLETPTLGLIGRANANGFDMATIRARLAHNSFPTPPAVFGIEDEWALLGMFVAGPAALAQFADQAPANTDDHPIVAYLAPRISYAPDSTPADRLMTLLRAVSIQPANVIKDDPSAARLAAYWQARQRFLEAGRTVRPTTDVQQMLTQVRAPLLDVLRISPDFRPAYDPLLRMARALAAQSPDAALTLLQDLQTLQPARPEAAALLQQSLRP